MATVYKVLGQVVPAAAILTTLYTVPASTSSVVSTLSVCNVGITTTLRVAVRPAGAAIVNAHYVVYDAVINQGDALFLTLGVTIAATDVVSVYSVSGNVAFSLFGSELT